MNVEQPEQPQEQDQTEKTTKDPSRTSDVVLYLSWNNGFSGIHLKVAKNT